MNLENSEPWKLPEGWAWASFADVAHVASNLVSPHDFPDLPHIAPNHIESETGRLLPYSTVAEDGVKSPKHYFPEGCILYSKIRPYLAKVVVPRFDGLCSADMYPVSTELDCGYLALWLRSPAFTEFAAKHQGRSVLPKINKEALARLPVPVPPLEEQRRIVAALEEQLSRLDAAVQSVEQSRTRSRQLWSSILHQMTEGTLSRHVRRPIQWKRTDEVAVVQGGIQKQAKRRPLENAFPFLRVANVPRGRLALDDIHEIELFKGELERYRLEVGDLLVVEGNGSPDQIGRAALWRGEIEDCVHQNHLIRVRPGAEMRADFLELAWNSPSVTRQLKKVASSTSGLHTLSTAKVKSVKIPVPSLEEQDELLEAVQQWRTKQLAAEAAQQTALARAVALRRSLLAEAFAGRLVPQDPADEPAAALLDRIRAEREAAGAAKSKRRSPRRAPAQRKNAPAADAPPLPRADGPALATATQPTLDLEMPS
ncbi:restriction endonuclease subunit S [Streptomyces somaliensis DSM 40738]|uniref:Type I restriction modification DNA specificity domain-containing protein n=1 Tax=Streptomyces somaliensis (strain ATCC 33201 / DSM 40738 / JCM 12659 / KCTC 9044 / NCTC 11332 / NRRL B-12077 / IP 733) TaxID=1134445 RepID=A0AA44IBS0_STRE0|nr:restriction endonuclease subunit S [Streptomyces somaliensis]MCQ0024346.1 restriction endonuclease subunit S [Streptomyces somaliensis DSM 40738]NKY12667.1 hypothetical protein [Streptomyces somaliensis DSM 40738]